MKSCPTCNRTYADETLTYCLADGSLLSAPYDPEATQRIYPSRVTNSPPTEVLPPKQSISQPNAKGANPTLMYVAIGLLALLIGGGIVALLKSETKNPSTTESPDSKQSTKSSSKPVSPSPRATPFSKRLEIPANQMWVDTGIDVTGKLVRIKYESGQWRNSPTSGWNDGNGRRPFSDQHLLIVPSADLSSLVGKTDSGTFFVGNSYEGYAGTGRLYLSINDIGGTFNDNSGSLHVTVSLSE